MASHGVFLGLCGFECHGPHGHLGFSPRLQPGDFRAAFTAAEGWGTIRQRTESKSQKAEVDLKWGKLRLRTVSLELAENVRAGSAVVRAGGKEVKASLSQNGRRITVQLAKEIVLKAGEKAEITMKFPA
jgi:hypothetical protein